MERIHRATARVLPVSTDGAVLLLHEQDPARPGERYWSSIGGAIDPGESLRAAAAREMREEAGIVADEDSLIHVCLDRQEYSWGGFDYVGDHTYFALPLDRGVAISFDGLVPEEIGNVLGADWWLPAALAATTFRPDSLPDIMTSAIAAVRGHQ